MRTLISSFVSLLFGSVSIYSSFSAGLFSTLEARALRLAGVTGGAAATGTLVGALAGVRVLRRTAGVGLVDGPSTRSFPSSIKQS